MNNKVNPSRASAALSDMARISGVVHLTIGQIVASYDGLLSRYVQDTLGRRMDEIDLRRAIKAILRGPLPMETYQEGMREAGSRDPIGDLQDSDIAAVETWRAQQITFVDGFARAVWAASGVDADPSLSIAVLDRVRLWVNTMRALGDLGKLNYLGNPMLTLDGLDGKENCPECRRYKGKRHRKSWWAARGLLERNGNTNYTCGRWDGACQHHFYFDSGEIAIA